MEQEGKAERIYLDKLQSSLLFEKVQGESVALRIVKIFKENFQTKAEYKLKSCQHISPKVLNAFQRQTTIAIEWVHS